MWLWSGSWMVSDVSWSQGDQCKPIQLPHGGGGDVRDIDSIDYDDDDEINKCRFVLVELVTYKDKFYCGCTEGTDHGVLFIWC